MDLNLTTIQEQITVPGNKFPFRWLMDLLRLPLFAIAAAIQTAAEKQKISLFLWVLPSTGPAPSVANCTAAIWAFLVIGRTIYLPSVHLLLHDCGLWWMECSILSSIDPETKTSDVVHQNSRGLIISRGNTDYIHYLYVNCSNSNRNAVLPPSPSPCLQTLFIHLDLPLFPLSVAVSS